MKPKPDERVVTDALLTAGYDLETVRAMITASHYPRVVASATVNYEGNLDSTAVPGSPWQAAINISGTVDLANANRPPKEVLILSKE